MHSQTSTFASPAGGTTTSIRSLDHTADIGADFTADSLAGLFVQGARALTDAITEVSSVRPLESRQVAVRADDRELLLVDWLEELLFLFDTETLLAAETEVDLLPGDGDELALEATVRGERYDPERHPVKVAIKGVTYHGLEIREAEDRWHGRIIFDI